MSDCLPLELQQEIITRLPIKLLIRYRSVSKSWKSLIDSSDFITGYTAKHTQSQHLLLTYLDYPNLKRKYVSVVDDDTFPQQVLSPTPPLLVKMLNFPIVIGSSHGLLCLHGNYCGVDDDPIPDEFPIPITYDDPITLRDVVVLWNIKIEKAVAIVLPNVRFRIYETVIGFGVCRETIDPKIVKIHQIGRSNNNVESKNSISWQVEVFTLSTWDWRSPYSSSHLPRMSIRVYGSQVVLDGILYWLASTTDGEFRYHNLIISFDLTSEEFREINLPESLAQSDQNLAITKLRESLVVLQPEGRSFVVWMMETGGDAELFTKLFDISIPNTLIYSVQGFRKSGEPVVQFEEYMDEYGSASLGLYEPHSKDISYLGFRQGTSLISPSLYSYTETLLLLDQPNFVIYDATVQSYISKQRGKNRRLLKHTSEGKMESVEGATEPFDNVPGGKVDVMKKIDFKHEKWLELEQQKVDLKRKKLELEQQKIDLKKKKMDIALLCADTSEMAPENLAVHNKLVAEILKNYG